MQQKIFNCFQILYDNEELSKSFNELQINSNEDNQINYVKEIVKQQQIKNINIDDEDEIFDDKNFHSEEQDELEIPDGKCFYITICALYLQEKYVYI
ncbi:unnamed protein product [Rhizophagus irregularis]|nr:unnamed protein product [Rhizophagus irregularis]